MSDQELLQSADQWATAADREAVEVRYDKAKVYAAVAQAQAQVVIASQLTGLNGRLDAIGRIAVGAAPAVTAEIRGLAEVLREVARGE